MAALRRLFKLKKPQSSTSPSPSLPSQAQEDSKSAAGNAKPPAAAAAADKAAKLEKEDNPLKYTFPSPWVPKKAAGEDQETAVVLQVPLAEPPSCTKCGGAQQNLQYAIGLSALLDVSKMLLSMLCVVLGVVVMVLMSATWVLTRASAGLEGVYFGLDKKKEKKNEGEGEGGEEGEEEKGGKVLIGVGVEREEGGSEVVLLRRDSDGELYELDNYDAHQPEEGYEFVPEIRPVIVFREERLAFAAARRAWVRGGVRDGGRAASCER
ncbi:hypothetical protein P167DRAFT_545429 [Morchella conica CCBAS932]|uniref:Uncharacterized protein n=1 Tax=Morchella conica CCBAS932 TaxID=1392247 RepID=A0A3N4KSX2_9PEZI|nr:hypothetical protein P167DRAFT_545429 [Morchella conica CCBAS932]